MSIPAAATGLARPARPSARIDAWTGAWALPCITFGLAVGIMPALLFVVLLLVFGGIGLVLGGPLGGAFTGFLAAIVGGQLVAEQPWLVVVPMIVGVAAFIAGIVGSVAVLRASGNPAPHATTWGAAGLGFLAQLLVNGGVYAVVTVGFLVVSDDGGSIFYFGGEPVPLTIFLVIATAVAAGFGVLFWWLLGRNARSRSRSEGAPAR